MREKPVALIAVAVIALFGATLVASFAQGQPKQSPTATDESKHIQSILAASDAWHAEANYRALFNSITADRLRRLQTNPSDTIAIQAAWEEVELSVPEKPGQVVRPDHDRLARFIGFLEGRGRVLTPQWWSEAILDARANRRGNVYAGGLNVAEREEKKPDAAAPPRPARFEMLEGKPVIRVGAESAIIPADLREKLRISGPAFGIAALITPSHCYVAEYESFGYSYRLACVERSTGKIRWVADVWGSWWGGASGQSRQSVEVTEQGNRVAVFGVSSIGFNAEVFRIEDGANVLRFSNSY